MRISDWSSAVCSSDLCREHLCRRIGQPWMFRQFMRPPCGMHARQVVEHLLRLRDTQHLARIAEAHAACDQIFEQQIRRRAAFARRRSEEHTSELQSLMRISYAVFSLKKKKKLSNQET